MTRAVGLAGFLLLVPLALPAPGRRCRSTLRPCHSFGFTYDSARSHAVLYGGKVYDGDRQVALDDLWLWDGSSWSEWPPREP